jgi:hypothetical protein
MEEEEDFCPKSEDGKHYFGYVKTKCFEGMDISEWKCDYCDKVIAG